ncbi:MAG: OmpA family protein [bacterium]
MSAGWDSGLRFDTEPVETWEWIEKMEPISLSTGEGKHKAKAVRGRMAEVLSRAVITFDTPGADNFSSLPIENVLLKVSEESRIRAPRFVLHPHFSPFEARLKKEDKRSLDNLAARVDPSKVVRIYVEGHTDSLPIAERSRHIYADNHVLSLARARSVAAYLSRVMNLPPYMFAYYGKGPDVPVDDNNTPEGRAQNRRVEVKVVTEDIVRRTSVEPFNARSRTEVVTVGLRPGEELKHNDNPDEPEAGSINLLEDLSWLEKENRDLEWILPEKGYMPPIPSLKVAVKHDPDSKLALVINGERVSPLNFEGSVTNASGTVALSLWRGVDLAEGDNRFDLVELDADGSEIARIRRTFHYSGPPVNVELLPALSKLVANGKQAPVIAVRLTDNAGYPARKGLIGRFSVDPPYFPHAESVWDDSASSREKKRYRFSIGDDGVALLKLKPTSRSGEAVLRISLADRSEEIKVWLESEPRDWILVGLAEGTAGYNTVSGNMAGLNNAGAEDRFYTDGKVAFFAKGRIKGKWLMTMSYDTSKTEGTAGRSLHQTIDPDTYYTLYGDSVEQDYEAASSQKLYLKIERSQFYALFGDFDTGLTVTELARYNRSFTGLKSELKAEKFGYNIFAARTDQSFVRDEIRGDGTSGLYRLSNSSIVINSEKVKIEIRDRFRSESIISTRELARHTDYNIDYQAGTLFFKEPVSDRDGSFNPVFIVVEYESADSRDQKTTFGGRGTVRLSGDKAELGASLIHEGNTGFEGDLAGLDATVELGEGTQLRAEVAVTSTKAGSTGKDGSAYLAEITHSGSKVKGKVYLREQDEDFGLGQQSAGETGTRKLGVDVSYRATDTVTVSGQGFRQLNYATGGEREVVEAQVEYTRSNYSLSGGLRQATDTVAAGKDTSTQMIVGGEYLTMQNRLKLKLEHDQSLGSNDNTDYPTRTVLGSDYRLSNTISLFAQQELTQGRAGDTMGTRMGMKAEPWEGGHATSSVEQKTDENSSRVFANLGLTQTWRVSEKWRLSGTLEQSRTFRETTTVPFNSNVPASSGGEDFTSVSLGASYSHSIWQWNARLETREADSEGKVGFVTDLLGEPDIGTGISASGTLYLTDIAAGGSRTDGGVRLGLAYRPLDSDWILLDKLDYKVQKEEGTGVGIDSWKIVNNMNANYQSSPRNQIAFQTGLKYSTEDIDGKPYSEFTGLFGVEDRYDLTNNWDMGFRTSVLHSWESGAVDYSAGISAGYSLMENAWLSFGYNFLGFVDDDFSGADFSAQGPYLRLRLKFDQKSIKDLLK